MPYYRITIHVKNRRKPYQGIRQIEVWNPDAAYRMVKNTVSSKIRESELIKLDVVMLPKNSDEVQAFIKKRRF